MASTAVAAVGRIEAALQLIEKKLRHNKSQVIGLMSLQQIITLGEFESEVD